VTHNAQVLFTSIVQALGWKHVAVILQQ